MADDGSTLSLDDLYKMTSFIYSEENIARSASATFSHFVEVCGMLTIHDRKKKREGLEVTDALCKALGWYFPLLAKMRIQSAEALIFRKFPLVCPYCRRAPHREADCKLVRGTTSTLDHAAVATHFKDNWDKRPRRLDDWQEMFQTIYPRDLDEHGRSTIGLLEELGELAEAVRVFEQHPKYFLGEAADTFSYIMGIANEHSVRIRADTGETFSLEAEFLKRYPGLCIQCGSRRCICPSVPEATVGRMAKEIAIAEDEHPFTVDPEAFSKEGRDIGRRVLESVGGHAGLSERLPFDRGDANRALVAICLKIADAVRDSNPHLSDTLMAEGLRIATEVRRPGSPRAPANIEGVLENLRNVWKTLSEDLKVSIRETEGLVGDLGELLDTARILFVLCSPKDATSLRVNGELRAIQESIKLAGASERVFFDTLPAATPNDFRRQLLDRRYDIVHFSGHADANELVFEDADGNATPVPLSAVADVLNSTKSVAGVILNACHSAENLTVPIARFTIGMDDAISDSAAIEFARGFYDAIARQKTVEAAFNEGLNAVKMTGEKVDHIKLLQARAAEA